MIRIINIRGPGILVEGVHREYCGRPGKGQAGLLGNPFWMGKEADRDRVCDEFEPLFEHVMKEKGQVSGDALALLGGKDRAMGMYKRMRELYKIARAQDVELACFCAPKRCHCETIKRFLDKHLEASDDTR